MGRGAIWLRPSPGRRLDMSAIIKLDDFEPLQVMAFGEPTIRFETQPEPLIALVFETKQFGTKTSIPIQVAMLPERAAVLFRLLEELRDRGMLPDAPGEVSHHWHQ